MGTREQQSISLTEDPMTGCRGESSSVLLSRLDSACALTSEVGELVCQLSIMSTELMRAPAWQRKPPYLQRSRSIAQGKFDAPSSSYSPI